VGRTITEKVIDLREKCYTAPQLLLLDPPVTGLSRASSLECRTPCVVSERRSEVELTRRRRAYELRRRKERSDDIDDDEAGQRSTALDTRAGGCISSPPTTRHARLNYNRAHPSAFGHLLECACVRDYDSNDYEES